MALVSFTGSGSGSGSGSGGGGGGGGGHGGGGHGGGVHGGGRHLGRYLYLLYLLYFLYLRQALTLNDIAVNSISTSNSMNSTFLLFMVGVHNENYYLKILEAGEGFAPS